VEIDLALVAVAVLVGVMVGLTGVGAGALMTPILIGGFGVSAAVAIATDLLFATATKIIGVVIHGRARRVDWKVSRSLWMGSFPGVVLGSALLVGLVVTGAGQWLTWFIALVVGVTSFTLLRRALVSPLQQTHPQTPAPRWLAPVGGAGIGLGVSLTSVGAGVLGMALLVRLSPQDTAPQRLVATDLLHAIPIALIAGVSYAYSGLVDWILLVTLLLGSLPGVIAGSILSKFVPSRVLNLTLGVVLLALAVFLVV
jgi:Predicted permeases